MRIVNLLFILLILNVKLQSQDLGAIGKQKNPFKVTGSVSASQILYTADGIPNRRPPYNYFLAGNLNVSFYGWSVPLSFTYSNQQSQFQQPFNQFGATPYYKWVKLYAGYSNMTFSSYTLNGHIFLGGGVQLTPPGLFRFSAMFGRLNRSIGEDTNSTSILPTFLRMGGGFKVGMCKGSDGIDFIMFVAKDDPNSISNPIKQTIQAAENAVMSLVFTKSFLKKINILGEYAMSALNADARADKTVSKNPLFALVPFYASNLSTGYFSAYKANANYTGKGYMLGIGYERIDPGYRTLGAYYFNDDLENYTANGSTKVFNGKINISGSFGLQYNDLKGDKLSKMSRNIYSANVSYTPSQRLNLNLGYSNFQTFTRLRTLSEIERSNLDPRLNGNPDTLRFTQLSQSANLGANYTIGNLVNKKIRNTISTNFTFQTAGSARGDQNVVAGTNFYNSTLSFSRNLTPQALSMTFSFNSNISELEGNKSVLLGPSVTASKGFLEKKIKLNGAISWSNTLANGVKIGEVYNFKLGSTYLLLKKHNLNANIIIVNRNSTSATTTSKNFTEYTVNMGYGYSF